jgi:hypothetical protein
MLALVLVANMIDLAPALAHCLQAAWSCCQSPLWISPLWRRTYLPKTGARSSDDNNFAIGNLTHLTISWFNSWVDISMYCLRKLECLSPVIRMSWVERHGVKCTTYNAAQSLDHKKKKEVLTGCCDYQVLDLRFVECKLCCYGSRGLGQRRGKPKAAIHRKKQVRRGGKRSKGFFINHHHKKLQSINWKTTVIPRNRHVLRDKIMGKNQGSCQQERGLFQTSAGVLYISRSMSAGMRDISLTSH